MGKNIIPILFFIFLISPKALGQGDNFKELGELKRKLSERKMTIHKLDEKISDIEIKLNEKNKKYLKVIRKKNELEDLLYAFQVEISLLEEKLINAQKKATIILGQVLISSIGRTIKCRRSSQKKAFRGAN